MDIKKRINARKIILSYFYQHCFFSDLQKKFHTENQKSESLNAENEAPLISGENAQESGFLDKDFLKAVADKKQTEEERDDVVQTKINQYALDYNIEEDFPYILNSLFDQWNSEDVETEYVLKVGNALPRYEQELIEKVNQHAKSFSYDQMDIIDQVLLLLGYIEYKELETPKEVILNETIELAKRYADDGSPKLINGLLHNIFAEL